jgi:hypothetical protein
MPRVTTVQDLQSRRTWLHTAGATCAGAALVAAFAFVLLLQPGAGSGPADVHVPDFALHLLGKAPSGAVHLAGGRIAEAQSGLSKIITALTLAAFATVVWALWKRRKVPGHLGLACFIGLQLMSPVSPQLQMNPARGVSAATARQLLGLAPNAPLPSARGADPETRYLLAQIAFIEGDRAAARRFAAGLEGGQMASPIEAPFRLQFLQGRPPVRSTVCFPTGCVGETARAAAFIVSVAAAILALALAIAAFLLRRALGRRCARIAGLEASATRRTRAFA